MFHDLTSFNITYIYSITSALENIAHIMMSWARELSGKSNECNNTNTSSMKVLEETVLTSRVDDPVQ